MSTKIRVHISVSERHNTVKIEVAYVVLQRLEQLNMSLQSINATVSGMVQGGEAEDKELIGIRCQEEFSAIFKEENAAIDSFDLADTFAWRIRRLPVRLTGPASVHQTASTEEYFRKGYY